MNRFAKPLVVALAAAVVATLTPASPALAAVTGAGRDGLEPREPSAHSVVFRAEAVIAAESARIWSLLVDLPGYADWNPFVLRASGEAAPGADVDVDVVLGKHVMRAGHVVLVVDRERRFCWRDAGWNSWFVYGQRCRWLHPQPDGTVLFKQELLLDGIFSSAAKLAMGRALHDGMLAETAALKRHAEDAAARR